MGKPMQPPFAPMEARLVDALPCGAEWQFEPKWDGFRCLAVKGQSEVELFAKSGKPLGRYFPEIVEKVASLAGDDFVLDGELVIAVRETLSFDALQMRLHPAESRVRKLAAETPARMILFDLPVAPGGRAMTHRPLSERRAALERFCGGLGSDGFGLSPFTLEREEAQAWLDKAGGALDGVIAKRREGGYEDGERAMLKVKRIRSADCVVGGFRYGSGSRQIGSLLLGLFNEVGKLDHVGFTSSIAKEDRVELTKKLESLSGGEGFTGNAPGGPSRWSTERSAQWVPLRHELVAEVQYDHATGKRFRHGTKFLRWRADKAPAQCRFEQIEHETRPGRIIEQVIRSA